MRPRLSLHRMESWYLIGSTRSCPASFLYSGDWQTKQGSGVASSCEPSQTFAKGCSCPRPIWWLGNLDTEHAASNCLCHYWRHLRSLQAPNDQPESFVGVLRRGSLPTEINSLGVKPQSKGECKYMEVLTRKWTGCGEEAWGQRK